MLILKLKGKSFQGLLDSGADATIISSKFWPATWPLTDSATHLQCIGHSKNPQVSAQTLNWTDSEGNSGTVIPYVIPDLPTSLWGRDILSQMNVIMCSPKEAVTFTIKLLKRASTFFCSHFHWSLSCFGSSGSSWTLSHSAPLLLKIITFPSIASTPLVPQAAYSSPETKSLILTLINQTFLTINATSPSVVNDCWLCYHS